MNGIRSWVASLAAALLLAACGGSDPDVPGSGSPSGAPTTPGNFTSVVSFGDSLSDVGTYTPATSQAGDGTPPFLGGKFTTNGPAGTVWVENVAAALGLPLTPAEVGFGTTSVQCPAAAVPALAGSCTAYGQGGAMVTDPNGINHEAGALTVPVVTQIDNHLARFGGFDDDDLVLVYAGNNDVFVQFGAFVAAVAPVLAQAGAGQVSADQANAAVFQAQSVAQARMKQAALELAGYVRSRILGNGARYVAVLTLSDIADTPSGLAIPPELSPVLLPVLTDLSRVFNLWLRDGLAGAPVQIVDTFPVFKDAFQNPLRFGIVNSTEPACDPARISALTGGAITDGSSLFCNAAGLRDGADPLTWLFADTMHPTTRGHQLVGEAVLEELRGFGWIQ